MVPTPTAIPAESEEVTKDSPPVVEEYKVPSSAREMPLDEDVSPSLPMLMARILKTLRSWGGK